MEENTDKPFQDLEAGEFFDPSGNPVPEPEYVDLDPDDPELLKLRQDAGDPTAFPEVPQ